MNLIQLFLSNYISNWIQRERTISFSKNRLIYFEMWGSPKPVTSRTFTFLFICVTNRSIILPLWFRIILSKQLKTASAKQIFVKGYKSRRFKNGWTDFETNRRTVQVLYGFCSEVNFKNCYFGCVFLWIKSSKNYCWTHFIIVNITNCIKTNKILNPP